MDLESLSGMMASSMPYGLITFLGLILAVLAAILPNVGNRTNPGFAVVGVGLTAIGSAVCAWWALPGEVLSLDAYDAVQLASFTRFLAWFGVSAVGFAGLAILAVAGARNAPRDFKAAAVGGLCVTGVVVLCGAAGLANATWGAETFYYFRAAEYAVLGLFVPVAMLGSGTPGPGQDVGAAAGVTFALVVAVCETAGRGVTSFFLMTMIGGAPVGDRAAIIDTWFGNTAGELPWMLATTAAAAGVALVATAYSARGGNTRAWAAVLWLPVIVLIWLGGTVTPAMCTAVAALMP